MNNTDLDKLRAILDNQAESGICSGDWERCSYDVIEADERHTDIVIPSVKVKFRFRTDSGRFIGMVAGRSDA